VRVGVRAISPVLLSERVYELRQNIVSHDGRRQLVAVVRQATKRKRRSLKRARERRAIQEDGSEKI
jgi:hypothetical protein